MKQIDLSEGYPVKNFKQSTKRYCQTLDLRDNPELIEAYRKLHSPEGVWPEVLQGIRTVGILEMEIYLLGTRLFMIVELPADVDWTTAMQRLSILPKQAAWEELTARYQQADPSSASAEKWQLMERIFHLYE